MNIYSLKVDSNSFQWIMPKIDEKELLNFMDFNCQNRLNDWQDVEWYSLNPKNKQGNFYSLGVNGSFAFDTEVYNSDLLTILEMSGEVLPLKMNGQSLYILNVKECFNNLDRVATKFDIYDDGSRGRILQYAFLENCMPESSLFKIPETSKSEILTYSGLKDNMDEFKGLYDFYKFEGLLFDRLWSS